jgi:hypothetical protein
MLFITYIIAIPDLVVILYEWWYGIETERSIKRSFEVQEIKLLKNDTLFKVLVPWHI